MQQEAKKREPCYILATGDRTDFLAITDILLAEKAAFCRAKGLAQLATLLEEVTGQIVIIDLTTWGTSVAQVLSDHVRGNARNSCICLVSEEQAAEIRSKGWSGCLHLVARDRLQEALPAVLRQCAEVQRMYRRMEELLRLERQSLYNTLSKEAEEMKLEDMNIFKKDLTRRSFLKGTAAAAAAAGVAMSGGMKLLSPAEAAPGEANNAEQVFYGSCRANCFGGCRVKITVRGGKVVKVGMGEFPDARYNRICAKGLTHAQTIYAPDRLKYPMKRVGERGAGQWEQITWEEAITTITDSWKKYQQESGKESIIFSAGTGNFGSVASSTATRLRSLMGAASATAGYDNTQLSSAARCFGIGPYYNANEMADLINAKTILLWGTNPTQAQIQNCHFINEARENGATVIHIDPAYNPITSKCDVHVPLRPATDAALAMAMMNIIFENGWQDDAFLKKSSVAPFLAKESDGKFLRLSDIRALSEGEADAIVVRGEDGSVGVPAEIANPVIRGSFTINGVRVTTAFDLLVKRVAEWTPERASELCDIPVSMIHEITKIYATKTPSTIYTGFGPDHYVNGHPAYMAIFTLAMITGNLCKLGAGAGYPSSLGFNLNTAAVSTVAGAVGGPGIALPKIPYVMEKKEYGGKPYELRSFFNYFHNPLSNTAGHTDMVAAFHKLDLVVVADWRMTDTARYADIVLPAAHWFETTDVFHGFQTVFVILQEKAVEPPAECKSDFQILKLLAEKMGFGEHFNFTEDDAVRMMCTGDVPKMFGVSYERMLAEKVIRGPFISGQPDGTYIHGEGGVLPTATGRATFYLEDPQRDHYFGPEQPAYDPVLERLPYWEPPLEAWPESAGGFAKNPLAEKYPLIYTSERSKLKTHTMFGHNPWLLELIPEPIVKVNPADAQSRGIAEGEYARLYNDLGSVVLKVVYNPGVRPGMVVVPKGWESDQFKEGNYAALVSGASHGFILNNNYFDALCQMEKA